MKSGGSVTHLIQQLEMRDEAAASALWERYFRRLVGLARLRMGGAGRRVKNEEDVALSVLDTFCRGLEGGRFPNLQGRDNLWKLLVVLTVRKAQGVVREENRQKRRPKQSGVHVLAQADVPAGEEERDWLNEVVGREPEPAFVAQMTEEFNRLLDLLDNDTLRSIARLKMEGDTNAEIGLKLGCVERTVERKLEHIRKGWEKA